MFSKDKNLPRKEVGWPPPGFSLPLALLGLLIIFVLFPFAAAGQSPLAGAAVGPEGPIVPCGTDVNNNGVLDKGEKCTFADFYVGIDRLIDFLLFYLALPLAAISIAIAGFMFLTSGDNEGRRTKAKGIIGWAIVGVVVAFGAWLIVNTILKALVEEGTIENPLEQSRGAVIEYYL